MLVSHSSGVGNLGGGELSLLHLMDQWRELRPDVEFFVVSRAPEGLMQAEFDRRGVQHRAIDFGAWVLPFEQKALIDVITTARMDSQAVTSIVSWIRELAPDLVVSNTIVSPWGALAARMESVPHVWIVHEYGDLDHGLEFRIGRTETFDDIASLSDLVVANSEAVRDHISAWVPAEKLHITYPPIDLTRARALAAEATESLAMTVPQGALRTVMVGQLGPSKGQLLLLTAIARMKDEGIPVSVTLVGDNETQDAADLLRWAELLGITDRVSAVGNKENPFPYIAGADLGVMASTCEAFGRVTVEYLALGKPVVASRSGASPELVADGETGWLFDAGSVEDLAQSLRDAHKNRDELLRRGVAARMSVDEHLALRYPVKDLVVRLESVAATGALPMVRMPNITREWLALPRVAERYRSEMHALRGAAHASATWRVGRLLMAPAKVLVRLTRRFTARRYR